MKKAIVAKNGVKPLGPYSPAVLVSDSLYISGQLGIDPTTGKLLEGIEAQTNQSLTNIKNLLQEVGMDMNHIVKTTVFLSDINNFAKMNEVYATYFNDVCPARSCFEVAKLPSGGLVEIEAIALKD